MDIRKLLDLYVFLAAPLRKEFAKKYNIKDRMDVVFIEKSGNMSYFGQNIKFAIHGTGVTFRLCKNIEIDIEDNIHKDMFLSYWSFYSFYLNFEELHSLDDIVKIIKSSNLDIDDALKSEKGILIKL